MTDVRHLGGDCAACCGRLLLVPAPWRRSAASLKRARHAAARHAHFFERVVVEERV